MAKDNIDVLYETLEKDGYQNLGSKEFFRDIVTHDAVGVYEKLVNDGYTNLVDAATFTNWLMPSVDNPDESFGDWQKPKRKRGRWFEQMALSEAVAPITPEAMQSYSEDKSGVSAETRKATMDYHKGLRRANETPNDEGYSEVVPRVGVAKQGVDMATQIADAYGGWAQETEWETKREIDASEQDWEERMRLYDEFEAAAEKSPNGVSAQIERIAKQRQAVAKQRQAEQIYNYLNTELARLEDAADKRASKAIEDAYREGEIMGAHARTGVQPINWAPQLRSSEISQLRKRLNLPKRGENGDAGSWLKQLGQGFGAGFSWSDLVTLGWGDLIPAVEENRVLEKVEAGEALDENEQEIYDLVQLKQDVEGYIQTMGGLTTAASVGSGVGQMVPYMAGFATGAGAAKVAVKPLTNIIVKKGAKDWVKSAVSAAVTAVPATALTPTAYLDYQQRTKEQYFDDLGRINIDAEGNLTKWAPTSEFKRGYQALVSGFLENFSELGVGELLEGPLTNVTRTIGKHLGLGRLYGMMDSNTFMRHLRRSVGWNGSSGEFVEEVFVNFTQPLLTGEPEQLKENFKLSNLWETYLVCAVTGGAMNLSNISTASIAEGFYALELRNTESTCLKAISNDKLRQEVHDAMHQSSITDMALSLSNVDWGNATTDDVANAMMYMQARTNRLMYKSAQDGQKDVQHFSDQLSGVDKYLYKYDINESGVREMAEVEDKIVLGYYKGQPYAIKSGNYASGTPTEPIMLVDNQGQGKQVMLSEVSGIQEFGAQNYLTNAFAQISREWAPINEAAEAKEDAEISVAAGVQPSENVEEVVAQNANNVSIADQADRPKDSFEPGEVILTSDGRKARVTAKEQYQRSYTVQFWNDDIQDFDQMSAGEVAFADVAGVPQVKTFDELEQEKQRLLSQSEQVQAAMEATAPTEQQPTATAQIPTDAEGNLDYESAPVDVTWASLVEQNNGEMAEALDTAQQMLDNATQLLNKLDQQPKGEELSVTDIQNAKAQKKRLAAKVKYWSDVLATGQAAMQPQTGSQPIQPVADVEDAPTSVNVDVIPSTTKETTTKTENGVNAWYKNLRLSEELDQNNSPFILSPKGNVNFGSITTKHNLPAAPIRLSMGDIENGYIHINRRHGKQIQNAGFNSIEDFVQFVVDNFTRIQKGGAYENEQGEKNQTYLVQLQDGHNNTLFIQLSRDGKYWNVNSAGVFGKNYGNNKENIWSASEVQSNNSAVVSDGSQSESIAENDSTSNGTPSDISTDKDTTSIPENQTEHQEVAENVVVDENVTPESEDTQPSVDAEIEQAEQATNPEPTEGQKEAGNYKKGHIKIDGFDITIETPKGVVRSGVDEQGNAWSVTMNNTYGYIRGTEGVDGDHIDLFLSDNLDGWNGNVYVVDQVKPDGSFDEHKVMYGFNSIEDAQSAYLSNYSEGWQGLGAITGTTKDEFRKWIDSSHRKTKPFAEYKSIKTTEGQATETPTTKTEQVETERLSLNEYLGRLGLSSPISDYMDDKLRNPRGLTASQVAKLEKEASAAANEYQKKRSAAIAEYQQLVEQGKIIPATRFDMLIATANGHSDNEAVQAARRALEKRGYDWITGEKIQPETVHTTPSTEQANAVPKTDIQKPQLDAFEEAVVNQGYIERKPNKAKFNIWEFVAGKEVRPTAKIPTVMEGVYYDKGFRVATDAKVLVKVKDTAYPTEYEGTARMRDGVRTDEGVKFPAYKKVIPDYKQADSRKIDFVDLLGFLNAVKERVTAEHKATNQHRSLSAALNNTPISMRLSNGEVVSFSLAKLIKFALAAKQIGADRIYGNDWTRAILAKKNGELALLIPVHPDIYPFEGSTRYYYAPELESKSESNKTATKSDTQPTQEPTPAVAQPTTDGVVDRSTIQLVMSDAEFAELLKSGTREQLEAYRNELDKQLALDGSTVLSEGEAIRKEYKQLVEEYGGKDNVPADRFDALNARYLPYTKLSDAIYDRMRSLNDRIREVNEQEAEQTKQQEKQQKAEFNDTAYNGFLKGKTPLAAAAANKALSKKYNFDGKTMTVAEYIEDAVHKNSVKLNTIEEKKYKGASRSAWNKMDAQQQAADEKRVKESGTKTIYTVNDHDFGKQAYAYAQYLLDKAKPQESAEALKAKSKPILASKEPTPTTKESTTAKIEDFGEKIGGARKDVARQRIKDSMAYSRTDLKNLKDPDKILSRANILKYLKEGEMTNQDATMLLALNMAVRGDGFRSELWLEKYRDAAFAWSNGQDIVVEVTDKDIDEVVEQLNDKIKERPNIRQQVREDLEWRLEYYNDYKATYEAINYPEVNRALKSSYIRKGKVDGKYWVLASTKSKRGWPYATMSQAVAKLKSECPVIQEQESQGKNKSGGNEDDSKVGSLYVTKDDRGYYRIKSRNISGSIYLSKRLYSRKEAEQYLQDNAEKLVERELKMTEAIMGSNIGMVERIGPDYRNGKDVTPQDFLDTFGFRGVEFGNWVPQTERQLYLNKAYDAIMDLCAAVNISPKAFSLGGRLGLAFGARGKSKALAHYESLKEVINLTRLKGAGSLAHEWFHALDNYISRQVGGDVSGMATSNYRAQRSEVAQAFRDLVYKMGGLAYSRRSSAAGPYWGEVWERAARLFQSYVYNKLGEQGIVSPLLVRKDSLYEETDPLIAESAQSSWPYPSKEENDIMKPYFDTLFDAIQEREENGNVILYQVEDGDINVAESKLSTEEVINLVKAAGVEVEIATEEQQIIAKAKANGTYLKAPNGKPTNLTPRQWVQVRTKAFKKWFGDWEKAARIEKLRHSQSIEATGNEYVGKYELNNKSAANYINSELRGEYTNADTGDSIKITRKGAFKVTRHDADNEAHLKSIALIPSMLENAIFITEEKNEKGNTDFDSYRYYVVGINMGGIGYTAKLVVGTKNGETYYDHSLTEIEKTNLIDRRDEISSSFTTNEDANFEYKDKRLISILQTNASKVVDANGEPMVVYHGTIRKKYRKFNEFKGDTPYWFTPTKAYAEAFSKSKKLLTKSDIYNVFLNVRNPLNVGFVDWGGTFIAKELSQRTKLPIQEIQAIVDDIQPSMVWQLTNSAQFKALVQRYGYDGLTAIEGGTTSYASFTPTQIKSATENVGTFDANNPDIRYHRELKKVPTDTVITYDNYYDSTVGIWKALPLSEAPTRTPDYESQRWDGSGVSSRYWYGEDEGGQYVIRESDHWSGILTSNAYIDDFEKRPFSRHYVPIASCRWAIDATFINRTSYIEKLNNFYAEFGKDKGWVFGKIYLQDLTLYKEATSSNTRYLRTSEGEVYGWMVDGKIYLTEKGLNPETPIHEYTHIWDMVCRNENPDLWKQGVELMKQSPLWEQVRTNPAYADIANNEDALASEVHARLAAPGGANILADMLEQQNARPSLIARIKLWLAKFWRWLRKQQLPESKLSIVEFANMPLKDLAVGRNLAESIAKANAKQKTELQTLDNVAPILPMIGRRRQEEMYAILTKRRPELSDEEKLAVIAELDQLPNNKLTNAAFHYFANGTIRLPEDMPKVEQAVKVAEVAKVDPMAYKSPMELINAHADVKLKEKRIDPDTVSTLTNKVDYGNGLTVYDVEDSEESRQNMRRIINTHFGEDSSPWCLLQGDGKGNLTGDSKRYWNYYNAQPKRVAFQDGKLLAFFASDGEPTWWDRQDAPHTGGIPATRKLPDGSGRVGTVEFNETTGEWGDFTNIHLGQRGDKIYEEWLNEEQISSREIREGDRIYRYDWNGAGIFNGYLEMSADATKTLRSVRWYEGVVPETVLEDNVLYDYYRGRIQRIQKISNSGDVVEWGDNGGFIYVRGVDNTQDYSAWFDQDGTINAVREMNPEGSASFLANYQENTGRLQRCTIVSEDGVKTFVSWNQFGLQQYRVGEEAVVMVAGDIVDATDGFSNLTSAQAEELADKVRQEVERRVAEYVAAARAKAAEWETKAGEVAKRYSDVSSFEQQGKRQLADVTTKVRYREAENTPPVAAPDQVQQMADAAKALAERLHTPVEVYMEVEDIVHPNAYRQSRMRNDRGWWTADGVVGINVSMHESVADIEATVLHEVVAHKGLREMLGEDAHKELCDRVWSGLSEAQRAEWSARYPDSYEAADEYMATIAEGNVTLGVWDRIVGWVRQTLEKVLGIKLSVGDKDIAYLMWLSRRRLERPTSAEQALAFAAKDAELREGAYRGRSGKSSLEKWEEQLDAGKVVVSISSYLLKRGFTDDIIPVDRRQAFLGELFEWLPMDIRTLLVATDVRNAETPYTKLDSLLRMKQTPKNNSLRAMIGETQFKALIESFMPKYFDYHSIHGIIKRAWEREIIRAGYSDRGNVDNGNTYLDTGNPNATFEATGKVGSNTFVRRVQDNAEPILKLQQRAKEAFGIKITDRNNAYNAMNRWTSKAKVQIDRYRQRYIEPMLKTMAGIEKAHSIGYPDVVDYIMCKSALERHNSGIPTLDVDESRQPVWNVKYAEATIAEFESKVPVATVKELWIRINLANRYILYYLVGSGNLSRERREQILGHKWKYYVPLMEWDMEQTNAIDPVEFYDFGDIKRPKGIGSSVYINKIDEGRLTRPANPIANMMNFGFRAIMSAENNKMKQVVGQLAADIYTAAEAQGKDSSRIFEMQKRYAQRVGNVWIPMPLGEVPNAKDLQHSLAVHRLIEEYKRQLGDKNISPTQREIIYDSITRLREEEVVRVIYNGDKFNGELPISSALQAMREVTYYVNGEKQTIMFADPLVAMAVNGELVSARSKFLRFIGKMTRILSGLFTSYNPAFVAANVVRDFRHSLRMHILDTSYGGAVAYLRNYPKAYGAMWRNARGKSKPLTVVQLGDLDIIHNLEDRAIAVERFGRKRVMDTLFDAFNQQGGLTGYVFTQNVNDLDRELRSIARRNTRKLKYPRWSRIEDGAIAVRDFIKAVSETSEGVSRYGTFLASLERGHTTAQAAQNAKDITVNFNRKGEWSQVFGSIWLFFNASVQATAQEFKAAKAHPGRVALLATYRLASSLMNQVALNWVLDMFNGDDDDERNDVEIPLHVRIANTVIPLSNGKYIKIPHAQGTEQMINALGVYLYELMRGRMDGDDFIKKLVALPFDTFSPLALPENGDILRSIMPTILTPIYDIMTNKDYLGRPIRRTRYSDSTPEYQLALRTTPPIYINLAKGVNRILGGNEIERGAKNDRGEISWFKDMLEFNPSNLQHLVEYYAGGLGKYANHCMNVLTFASDRLTKGSSEVELINSPGVTHRFLGEAYVPSKTEDYYEVWNRLQVQHDDYNKYLKLRRETGRDITIPDNILRDEKFYNYVKNINKAVKLQQDIMKMADPKSEDYEKAKQAEQDAMFEAIYLDNATEDADSYEEWKEQYDKAKDEYNQKYNKK